MKKVILSVAALATAVTLCAQTSNRVEPQNKGMDRIWFSVSYMPKFMLSEGLDLAMPLDNRKTTAHNYAFEAGYLLLPRLSLGAGIGYERYWLKTGGAVDMLPLYLHGSWFWGRRPRRGWFAYGRVGAILSADGGARSGFTGGVGVGYRLKLYRRFGLDFKAGYDYSGAPIRTSNWSTAGFGSEDWSRHSLSAGIGLVF